METINYKDYVSWLEEKIEIIKKNDTNQKITTNELSDFLNSHEKIEKIFLEISEKRISTLQIEELVSQIKIDYLKSDIIEYLEQIKKYEKYLIDYFYANNLLDIHKEKQNIKIFFKWYDFDWIDRIFLDNLIKFSNWKESFSEELKRVKDNKTFYFFNFIILQKKDQFIIQNIYINKN